MIYLRKLEAMLGTWSNIGELMGCKKKRVISEIEYNNASITSNRDIAQSFYDYFDSVPSDLRNKMPNSLTDPLSYIFFLRTSKTNPDEDQSHKQIVNKLNNNMTNGF